MYMHYHKISKLLKNFNETPNKDHIKWKLQVIKSKDSKKLLKSIKNNLHHINFLYPLIRIYFLLLFFVTCTSLYIFLDSSRDSSNSSLSSLNPLFSSCNSFCVSSSFCFVSSSSLDVVL